MSAVPQSARVSGSAVEAARPTLDLRTHLLALRRFWKSVLVCALAGLAAAFGASWLTQPQYETRTTFFVATQSSAGSSALQADEFAQRRINSYVGVINSERLAQIVIDDTGGTMTTAEVSATISASVDPDTVLMTVTVRDVSADRSLIISKSIAANLDKLIGELDNRGTQNAVQLRVISGPTLNPAPVAPRWKLNLAIGLLLGLGLGVAQALIRQQLDATLEQRTAGRRDGGAHPRFGGLRVLRAKGPGAAARRSPVAPG